MDCTICDSKGNPCLHTGITFYALLHLQEIARILYDQSRSALYKVKEDGWIKHYEVYT